MSKMGFFEAITFVLLILGKGRLKKGDFQNLLF